MCECIQNIDADLKDAGQALNATMFGLRRPLIDLIRTDKWVSETRRGKPRVIIASYCPFCGEKYVDEDAAAKPAPEVA